jgi:hypothetical protein
MQMVGEVDSELSKLSESMTKKKWTPRTHCRMGYVMAVCSEYQG